MNFELFRSNYLRAIFSPDGDDVFSYLRMQTGGLTSPRTAKLINLAASCMEEGERYVETGVFTGYTLIAAGFDNRKIVLGIDSFDMNGPDSSVGCEMDANKVREALKKNAAHFNILGHVVEGDFKDIKLEGIKTGVSFIDARHDYESVTKNLEWLEPSLAKDAVLIFDDVDCEGVDRSILFWAQEHLNYELLFFAKSIEKMKSTPTYDKTFVNGLAVMRYRGN